MNIGAVPSDSFYVAPEDEKLYYGQEVVDTALIPEEADLPYSESIEHLRWVAAHGLGYYYIHGISVGDVDAREDRIMKVVATLLFSLIALVVYLIATGV